MRCSVDMVLLPLLTAAAAAAPAKPTPVKICFKLPSTYTGTVGVTVAIVDKENPDWIITHACYLNPFNVTEGQEQQGCISWDGIDENFWPVPPGTYGLKGIMTNVTYWEVDKQYHAITLEATGAVGPVPIDLTAPAASQSFFIDGDPVGSAFTSVGINTNFPDSPHTYANLYNSYLENAYNNYLVDLAQPHGHAQRVWRWHDAGIGGGYQTATNGLSVWSQTSLSGEHLYRADVGNENVAVWGNCSFAYFYTFPGVLCLEPGTQTLALEAVPGKGWAPAEGNNSTILWALTVPPGFSGALLTAYDGYDPNATIYASIPLPACADNASIVAMAIRNSQIHLLASDGIVSRIDLDPTTGLPAASGAVPVMSFNVTAVGNLTSNQANQGYTGPIAVDVAGRVFVAVDAVDSILVVDNTSNTLIGKMQYENSKSSGSVQMKPFGIKAMTTYVNASGISKLIVLEAGGAERYMQFDLGTAGCGNESSTAACKPGSSKVDEVWNNIMPFGGVGAGWVYDPASPAFGWGSKSDGGQDLIKINTNVTGGDWSIAKIYEGVAKAWLLDPYQEQVGPADTRNAERGGVRFVIRNNITYLVLQHGPKQIYKYNESRDTFTPCAGIVVSFFNDTHQDTMLQYVWHDANDDGTWVLNNGQNNHPPDWSELRPFAGADLPRTTFRGNWNGFYEAVQDDLSFLGPAWLGYWHWPVTGWDAHANPIYAASPELLFNDSIMAARFRFNASTDKATCPTCAGLPPTHGGNELASQDGPGRSTARFTDPSHREVIAVQGAVGSDFRPQGGGFCFSQDSCPQWKLAWHTKNASGHWNCKWRVGRAAIAKATGSGQFDNAKPDLSAGIGSQPMTVEEIIGNTVSICDMMRAGILVYTTDGVYVDTLFTTMAGAPGYRKNFDFGETTVYDAPGEYFAPGQTYVDPATGQVHITWGKTTMFGFVAKGWTKSGVPTAPVTFVGGPQVTLAAENIGEPIGIASQLRGFPPVYANLSVVKAPTAPALDGSLTGWEKAAVAHHAIDGLNVNGPAEIDWRLMYAPDMLYVHVSINQTQTGWKYPLPDMEPIRHIFAHGRGATTCSLYVQGNTSHPYRIHEPQTGRRGDARIVFGLFQGANPSIEMGVLGMYPFWDPTFGPATPAVYAVQNRNVTMQNVGPLDASIVKRGFTMSADGYTATMAAAIPRSALPWMPPMTAGMLTGGDFSCNINGFQKDWWTNYDLIASQMGWDEPSEAALLCPSSWGNFSFVAGPIDQ